MKLSELGEDAVVTRLTRSLRVDTRVKLGAGDDCAVVETAGGLQLLKSDCVIEGIHFLPDTNPKWIGWKAMCRSISDIAAMGGTPLDALVTLAVRPDTEFAWLRRVYAGLEQAARMYKVNLVGGETAKSPGPFFLSVALTGSVKYGRYIARSGGQQGDLLYVTGKLGGSLGGRHMRFRPRVAEAHWLVSQFPIHAMMDLSDGLASDLPRLARASGLRFELDLGCLPLHRGSSAENGLSDGEDYELLFALPESAKKRLEAEWPETFPKLRLTAIGRLVAKGSLHFFGKGYDHFAR
ncbi:MAG: thiamine-monophosphate kinase [Verrucomicrobia bacterium]|nr:thiamine-monophosphate kinase [Verrucomicrobiota bacterium]